MTAGLHNRGPWVQLPFNDGDTRAFRWTSRPVGNFELINGTRLEGWAVDFDEPETSIAIDAYLGGPAGTGRSLGEFTASSPRPDLTIVFGIPGNNGFNHDIGSCPSGAGVRLRGGPRARQRRR